MRLLFRRRSLESYVHPSVTLQMLGDSFHYDYGFGVVLRPLLRTEAQGEDVPISGLTRPISAIKLCAHFLLLR